MVSTLLILASGFGVCVLAGVLEVINHRGDQPVDTRSR